MKKILIADKDESLKDAFRVVFPSDEYEIIFTSNGKEIEKIADEYRPEIYILNIKLEKKDGIDIYKELKEKNMLQNVRFFFMKDEGTELDASVFRIDGIIEKPINFFRVHQMIDRADAPPESKPSKRPEENAKVRVQLSNQLSSQLSNNIIIKEKTNMLEDEIKKILHDSIENMKMSIVEKISPLISKYMEENVKTVVNDTAERLVREEMDKLLSILRESRK